MGKEEHHSSLIWVVARTSEANAVNIYMDNVLWSQSIKVSLPALKKRNTEVIDWEPSELPSCPMLVHNKAIEKHTKVCVYLPKHAKEETTPKQEQ